VLEADNSCSYTNTLETPVSKAVMKRSSLDSLDSAGLSDINLGEASITKPKKLIRVKVEPKEDN
jgi:hypothetical protein